MLAILCCILDSRGDQHNQLIESVGTCCLNAETLIYAEHQELSTVERYVRAYEQFKNPKYSHYMFGASDIVLATNNFDAQITKITNRAEQRSGHRIFVLYPDDGVHGIKLCTHPIFTREFLQATGEFFPSNYMRHCFVDNYIMSIATKTDTLIFCPGLKLIHNHPISTEGKRGIMDEHYVKVYDKNFQAEDKVLFGKCMTEHAPAIIQKIKLGKTRKQEHYRYVFYRQWKRGQNIRKIFIDCRCFFQKIFRKKNIPA